MYAITATVTTFHNDSTRTKQVPTFYLDENVQGITDEDHAARVATDVLTAMLATNSEGDGTLHVTAVKVNVDTYCKDHDIFGCWFAHG